MNLNRDFDKLVQTQIRRIASAQSTRAIPLQYMDLLEQLDGIFPAELDRQLLSLGIDVDRPQQGTVLNAEPGFGFALPIEHPVNYEWRFTNGTAGELAKAALAYCSGHARGIACLGTPTVAIQSVLSNSSTAVRLLDISEPLISIVRGMKQGHTERFDAVVYDAQSLISSELRGTASVVVMDPPWYLDYFSLFFARAGELLGPSGGLILAPLFPRFARHSAAADLKKIENLLRDWGCISMSEEMTARFSMPKFERLVLERLGATIPPTDWRKAQVYSFQFGPGHRLPILDACRLEREDWIRFGDPGGSYVWNRASINQPRDTLELRKLVQTSISRHDRPERSVFLWTSSNEIFVGRP